MREHLEVLCHLLGKEAVGLSQSCLRVPHWHKNNCFKNESKAVILFRHPHDITMSSG